MASAAAASAKGVPSAAPAAAAAPWSTRVLGVPPRFAAVLGALAALGAVAAALRPQLARPIGAVALGLTLFWVRWRYFRVEGVAGVPFSHASRALLRKKTKTT